MWEPFTERARRSIVLAQEEAQRLGNNYIGTEHILLGIISEGESLAAKVLESLGVNLAKVRQEVEAIVGRGGQTVQQEMVFTPRAKRVIELAFEEARQLNHNYIGTEHLLLGLIREGEGVAARVLTNLGVDPARVRVQTTSLLGAEGQPAQPKGKSKTPTLDAYGRDLTQLARDNKLDPVIGRAEEIERVIQILSRRTKNNPALIGEPGVGKTAIAEGLAQRVVKGEVPEPLRDRRVITLDLAGLVAGTKYRGEFEERMKRVMDEIRAAAGEIILFIDELHTLVGAGAAEGAIDASNIIKPALARGELQCIGATTLNEFRKHIEKDSALERRFQPIMVGEPSVEETIEILKGLRDRYEAPPRSSATATSATASCPTRPSISSTRPRRACACRRPCRRPRSARSKARFARSRRRKRPSSSRRSSRRPPPSATARRNCGWKSSASSKSGKSASCSPTRSSKSPKTTSPTSSVRGRASRCRAWLRPRPRSC
jgi:ATP-dependent Clp protease ATP-binding subunit ClpC